MLWVKSYHHFADRKTEAQRRHQEQRLLDPARSTSYTILSSWGSSVWCQLKSLSSVLVFLSILLSQPCLSPLAKHKSLTDSYG